MGEGSDSAPSNASGMPQAGACSSVAAHHALRGALGGLVFGLVWGILEEKKFVFRNVTRAEGLREPPIRLFNVLRRSATTVPIAATFLGVYGGLCCAYRRQLDAWPLPEHPHSPGALVCSGAAGTAAGAVRSALSEVALRPVLHMQKSATAGVLAVTLCSAGQQLERLERAGGGGEEWRQQRGEVGQPPWPDGGMEQQQQR